MCEVSRPRPLPWAWRGVAWRDMPARRGLLCFQNAGADQLNFPPPPTPQRGKLPLLDPRCACQNGDNDKDSFTKSFGRVESERELWCSLTLEQVKRRVACPPGAPLCQPCMLAGEKRDEGGAVTRHFLPGQKSCSRYFGLDFCRRLLR